jgi:hypothetical protein
MKPPPPRPLLRRSPLQPGESLPSLLARLAVLNGYSPALMFSVCFEAGRVGRSIRRLDNDDHPLDLATYQRLAILTGVAATDLIAATIHRYGVPLTLPHRQQRLAAQLVMDQPIWSNEDMSNFRDVRHAQFCPACLRDFAYHRLIWAPLAVACCLHHACLLVSRCPGCDRDLIVDAVVRTRCRTCGMDLREARPRSLSQEEFGVCAERMLVAWLEGLPMPISVWTPSLPAHPPAVLFGLVKGLKTLMLERLNHAALVPAAGATHVARKAEALTWVQHELNRLAFGAITDWPKGLLAFARRLKAGRLFEASGLEPYAATGKVPVALEQSRVRRIWREPEFAFVRTLFAHAGLPLPEARPVSPTVSWPDPRSLAIRAIFATGRRR